jgi:hypothetical protein
MKQLVTIALVFSACLLEVNAENWLFIDGKSQYTIVLPKAPSITERTATNEFQQIIKEISGVELPVTSDVSPSKGKHVYIGFCRATALSEANCPDDDDEGYYYYTKGNDLFIYGGRNRGTMNGVYAFLERELGVHWYTSAFTKIPKRKNYALRHLYHHEAPTIRQRLDFYYDALTHDDWAAHNLLNTQYLLSDSKYGRMTAHWGIHTFHTLLPPADYFNQHPEYFSLYKGSRSVDAQLCLSNNDMRRELTKRLKESIAKNPGYWCYDVSQNDNGYPCECPDCQRLVKRYGGQSGAMIWFVNQVANDIKKDYPNVLIGTFAYWYTRQAPTSNICPVDNVVIRLCDIECCMAHPLEKCEQNHSFLSDLNNWKRIAKNICVWDYTTGFSNYMLPFPNFDVLSDNFRLFARYGVMGILEEGSHNAQWNEFSELKQWMIAKLLWNPSQNTDSLARQFIEDYYGKAASIVWQYYQLCKKQITPNKHFTIAVDWQADIYSDKFIADGMSLMRKAYEIVGDDKEMAKRLNRLQAQILYLKLRRNTAASLFDGTLQTFIDIIKADDTLIRENDYKLNDLLKDLEYH